MTRKLDHPLRLARIKADVTQSGLARDVGLNRSAVTAIEEGRVRMPRPETRNRIETRLGLKTGALRSEMLEWAAKQENVTLSTRARATLALEPRHVAAYASFSAWREQIVDSPTAFASLLRVNADVVARYEAARNKGGMSDRLAGAIVNVLGVSDAYLLAVQKLPVG
jgi:transcriptional regulator with XRE-family HTH domain